MPFVCIQGFQVRVTPRPSLLLSVALPQAVEVVGVPCPAHTERISSRVSQSGLWGGTRSRRRGNAGILVSGCVSVGAASTGVPEGIPFRPVSHFTGEKTEPGEWDDFFRHSG